MRLLLEIILAAALIALAWEKSLEERASEIPWIGDKIAASQKPTKIVKPPQPPPASTPAAWMWDPTRRTVLDTPRPQPQTVQPASSVSGSWMWDPNHKAPLDPPRKSPGR